MDVEKLLAAIGETERLALAASPGPWRADSDQYEVLAVDGEVVCEGFALSNNQLRATVNHIAHNDPAAVLRRCTQDRNTIGMCQAAMRQYERGESDTSGYTLAMMVLCHLWVAYGISVEEETTGE